MEKPKRLQKILAEHGIASRRKAEVLISEGKVTVNGTQAKLGQSASESDDIRVFGKQLKKAPKVVYYMLNKPRGYVVSLEKQGKDPTIFDLFKLPFRVFPVGRLDKESEGLLLLTNDGKFAQKISHPRKAVEKTYEVTLERPVKTSDVKEIEKGILLQDEVGKSYYTTGTKIRKLQSPKKVLVTIHIGKYHVIRKMFGHFGYSVEKLKRVMVGKMKLGNLKPGEIRQLTHEELADFSTL